MKCCFPLRLHKDNNAEDIAKNADTSYQGDHDHLQDVVDPVTPEVGLATIKAQFRQIVYVVIRVIVHCDADDGQLSMNILFIFSVCLFNTSLKESSLS